MYLKDVKDIIATKSTEINNIKQEISELKEKARILEDIIDVCKYIEKLSLIFKYSVHEDDEQWQKSLEKLGKLEKVKRDMCEMWGIYCE